ncbi:MAG: hypothetical protein LBH32_05100 [Dysgonamonadaceae bacterium]|jgi:hypothetical protein|nr:hypothetical protein [Dysgonamonadaceae bacterium]
MKTKLISVFWALFCLCAVQCDETDDETGNGDLIINGGWYMNLSSGTAALVSIDGSYAKVSDLFDVSCLNPLSTWVSAVSRGIVQAGTPYLKNIKKKGKNEWSCLMMAIQYNSVPEATGLQYLSATLILETDNQTIYLSFDDRPDFRAGTLSKIYVDNGCNGGNNGGEEEEKKDRGTISFWTAQDFGCGTIDVTLNEVGTKTITYYFVSGTPACGDNGTASFSNLPYGTYLFSASCSEYSWQDIITLSSNCITVKLTK